MIPIYRAKKIDSDEYAYGFCFYDEVRKEMFISNDAKNLYTNRFRVDTTTLSIHFTDMLDSQGNKIFASLQEDGKGGDIMQDDEYFGIAKYKDCQFVVEYEDCIDNIDNGNFDVIGIQQ